MSGSKQKSPKMPLSNMVRDSLTTGLDGMVHSPREGGMPPHSPFKADGVVALNYHPSCDAQGSHEVRRC